MKTRLVFNLVLLTFCTLASRGIGLATADVRLAKLAPPTNVRVEAARNAVKVTWEASTDEASYMLAGYNVYFGNESLAALSPNQLPAAVQVGKGVEEYVVRGLENGRQYFIQVRSRNNNGDISTAGQPENEAAPLFEGKIYALAMYDDDPATSTYNSGYGWNRKTGQDQPGYHDVRQHGKYVDILMMESPAAKQQSLFISPAATERTTRWPVRNHTLIADMGTEWLTTTILPDSAFTTQAEIKSGHVYILKMSADYYLKLRVDTYGEVNLLLPAGAARQSTSLNKITFTYVAQLGQSYQQFLTGKP
ncbi:fibronectin type III domain-containing protein [candidate division KSB1 bacterium]|nr:fibronectin type III domain-containing protein [candidate division KSB1 bacterium]